MADADAVLDAAAGDFGDAEGYNENDILGDETVHDDETTEKHDRKSISIKKDDAEGDLYDAVLEPGGASGRRSVDSGSPVSKKPSLFSAYTAPGERVRRYCVFVANMTWWTTDEDLRKLLETINVTDIVDIKFYDNRSNGQSKGYALVVLVSEASQKTAIEKVNKLTLHGQTLVCMQYSKQALAQFEAATISNRPNDRMRTEQRIMQIQGQSTVGAPGVDLRQRLQQQQQTKQAGGNFLGTIRIGTGGTQTLASGAQRPAQQQSNTVQQLVSVASVARPLMAAPGTAPQQQYRPPVQYAAPPPQQQTAVMTNRPPPQMVYGAPPPIMRTNLVGATSLMGQQTFPPPGAHINPAVYPNVQAPPPQPQVQYGTMGGGAQHGYAGVATGPPQINESEFEEIMNRNRTVSSSAISRAVSDAAAGDYASAIETLVTAIGLIRQSRVANDDRCRVLISSLEDTLNGIENKSYSRSSRSHKHSRQTSRSPDRSSRKRTHRRTSRSRSRSPRYDYSPSPRSRRY